MVKPGSPKTGRPVGGLVLGLLGVGVLVLLAGVWLGRHGPGSWRDAQPAVAGEGVDVSAAERERWFALVEALEDEVEARKELARDVTDLRDALAAAGLLHEAPGAPVSDPVARDTPAEAGEDALGLDTLVAGRGRTGFDAAALVAAGLDSRRAEILRERWEEHELDKLYLRDQAAREGWMISPRHRSEQDGLSTRLREDLGEDDYAALLYATGAPNTIEVTDVLARSPAREAGLETGDEIIRYDDERVFRPNELRLATAAGEPNELVSIEVRRDGRPITLRVRRGPLGVLLQGATRPPQP